jgi:hypothetical protein
MFAIKEEGNSTKIKSISVQTKLNSVYYIELHVWPSTGHPHDYNWSLKHMEEEIYIMQVLVEEGNDETGRGWKKFRRKERSK